MEPTEDELEEVIETALADNGYEYVATYMAFKITEAVRKLYAEKKAEHQKKLNVVHFYYCAVFHPDFDGTTRECDCSSTTTIDQGAVHIDGS